MALSGAGVYFYASKKTKEFLQENKVAGSLVESYQEFKDPKAETSEFSFLVIGDTENKQTNLGPNFKEFTQLANQSEADFVVHLGDFTNRGTETEFQEMKSYLGKNLDLPYYMVAGNHDILTDPSRELYKNHFIKTYYSWDHKNSHFIVLDNSNSKTGFDQNQLDFLTEELQNNTDKDHVFVFIHRPVNMSLAKVLKISDGIYPEAQESFDEFERILSASEAPIAEVFAGHIHTYFNYSLQNIPVTISGGGGSKSNLSFWESAKSFHHYLEIKVKKTSHRREVQELGENEANVL
ncbi:metallophosphoesterase [Patescibacteria group bacterium]|nr:metallophosphoesterase [Patescibacteria group bacterium]